MSLWHLLCHGKWSHDLHRGRDAQGRLLQFCTVCDYARLVLDEEAVIGPAHHQRPDLGARVNKAWKTGKDTKVAKFPERMSSR